MDKRIAIPIMVLLVVGLIGVGYLYVQQTNKVRSAEAEVAALEREIVAVENEASALEREVSTLEGEVSTLRKRVSTLEADLRRAREREVRPPK
jgi:predicted  nucleic acid-binding Zn-ribbon protein